MMCGTPIEGPIKGALRPRSPSLYCVYRGTVSVVLDSNPTLVCIEYKIKGWSIY